MRAWLQTGFGELREVRGLATVPAPSPGPGEVRVRVLACALNRLDVLQRRAPVVATFSLPHIGGMDVVGVVESVGDGDPGLLGSVVVVDPVVTDESCAQCRGGHPEYCAELRTVGSSRPGGLTELVVVPSRNVHPVDVPADDLDTIVALACAPVAGVTAWHALLGAGRLEAGESVVIPGAGSGLGIAGIQLARSLGASVIALAGDAAKAERARELGARHVIDRSAGDWVAAARAATDGVGVDLVWDHVGGPFLQQAIDASRIGGRVVMSGTTAGGSSTITNTSVFHWGRTIIGHGGYSRQEMADTLAAYRSGRLVPVIDSVWPFEAEPEAERRLESGDFFGKVIVMGPGIGMPNAWLPNARMPNARVPGTESLAAELPGGRR
ncbi:MAG: zinc-binding dehydrogenase [Microbacteriaceae bacterium]